MKFVKRILLFSLGAALLQGCASVRVPSFDSSPHMVQIGAVSVNAETRTVTATGWVNQVQGPIELLACGPEGKRHESIFVLQCSPTDLQAAMLLAGAKAGPPMAGPGQGPPKGSPVEIWVEWILNGVKRVARAEDCIERVATGAPLGRTSWLFTGSVIENGYFKALAEESLIVTYWDPWAIINMASPLGSDDDALRVRTSAVPPIETEIKLHIVLK